MLKGNVTKSPRPSEEEVGGDGICSSCKNECSEVEIDNSYSDAFGLVTDWSVGSNCCGEEIIKQ